MLNKHGHELQRRKEIRGKRTSREFNLYVIVAGKW